MRTLTYQLRDLKKVTIEIGFEGENNRTQVRIDCGEVFAEYPNAEAALKVQAPKGGIYPATVTRDGNMILWTVRDCDVANKGNGEFQLTFTDGETVVKTCPGKIHIDRSLKGSGTAPSGVQDWLDNAEKVLEDLEDAEVNQPKIVEGNWYVYNVETGEYVDTGVKAQGEDGDPGQPGTDATPDLITVPYEDLTFPVAAGTQCYHDGKLYEANQAIQTSEQWTAAHWTETTVEGQIGQLKSALQLIPFTKASAFPIACMPGYYPSSGAYNPNLNKNTISLGMIPLKKGAVVKIEDATTGHVITGLRAYLYNKNYEYIKSIGNYNTNRSIEMDQDCYALITLLIPSEKDGNDYIEQLKNSVLIQTNLIDYETLYRDYEGIPATFELGSLDMGMPISSTTTARSSVIKMAKGSEIYILNNAWYIIVSLYDISNMSFIEKIPSDTSKIYNKFTVPYDCYIRFIVRNRNGANPTSDQIAAMPKDFLVKCNQLSEEYELPAYYFEDDYLPNKINAINGMADSCGFNGDMFVFLTDTHWTTGNNKRSPMLLEYVLNNTSVSRVFFGGDACNTETTVTELLADYCTFRKAFDFVKGENWIPIIGNHEYYPNTSQTPNAITYNDLYAMVIRESDQFFKVYHQLVYTFTNERAGIVYVMLSCSNRDCDYDATGQFAAFQSALDDVPAGYHVLVICHGAVDANNALYEAFDDYQTELESRKANGLEVIGVLCGHIHGDYSYVHGDVTVISSVCDGGIPSGTTKQRGTTTEQAFDVVGIDKANKTVYLKRIGAGSDRSFTY